MIKEAVDEAKRERAPLIEVVDVENAFQGREICTPEPWAHGAHYPSSRTYSFQPNFKGHAKLAEDVLGRAR